MIIAVDFDGTIVSENRRFDDLTTKLEFMPGAFEGLHSLKRAGHILMVHSARYCPSKWEDWKEHPLHQPPRLFDPAIWARSADLWKRRYEQMEEFLSAELPGVFECVWTGRGKPSGVDLFIDDRCMHNDGSAHAPDWYAIAETWGEEPDAKHQYSQKALQRG